MRLERLREQQENDRLVAQGEVEEVESRLPQLEAEEMVCLQRLQNSRIVTQSVLEELESSLGKQSSVASLLRQKQKGQDDLQMWARIPEDPDCPDDLDKEGFYADMDDCMEYIGSDNRIEK